MVKIATMGDNVVDCYVLRGEMFPGGNCLNVSIFLRRSGVDSAYIGRIGKDPAGDLIWDALVAEGVDVSRLGRLDGPTAWCLIGHRDNDRIFLDHDLGVSMFTPSADDLAGLESSAAVHIGQSSGLDTFVPAAARRTLLSYDFSTRRDPEHWHRIARHCFLASLSGGNLSDAEVDTIADEVLKAGASWVLVTRGAAGALLRNGSNRYRVGAAAAIVVDTLGAGDSFIARTFLGLLRQEQPTDLLAAAAQAAADTCGYFGAIGFPAPIDIGPQGRARVEAAQARLNAQSDAKVI